MNTPLSGKISPAPADNVIMLVTGMSGAGKTTALKTLEDMGWEAIDNFPIRLLPRLLATAPNPAENNHSQRLAIGFDSRTREFAPQAVIEEIKKLQLVHGDTIGLMFLDCAGQELARRYNETRRRHPLAKDRPAESGIAAERELLEPLRRWADHVVNTTDFSAQDLKGHIQRRFSDQSDTALTLTISSFGFARGMPPVADMVFDMRFLRNPHWDENLRPMTGQDGAVGAYISKDQAFDEAYNRILGLLSLLLPRYAEQKKAYVHIAFGCTGGRHRSVYMAECIARGLRKIGFSPSVAHRNLTARPMDVLEQSPG